MRNRIKQCLLNGVFLLVLLGLLVFASRVFQPKNNTEAAGMEDVAANGILGEPENSIDVLCIGDSVTYCSVIPNQIWRDYGITSYVCGTSLQKLYYSKDFLYKAFETQSPKVVMLEMTPAYSNFMYQENYKTTWERLLPVFRYHDRWKDFLAAGKPDATLYVEYTHQEINKGYYYSPAIEAVEPKEYINVTDEAADMLSDCKKTLLDIKAFCEERDVELILFSAPSAATWRPEYHNGIVKFAQEENLTYFDMNYMTEEVPIDWSKDSFDGGDHLNYDGAKKTTAYLGKYLNEMGIFTDKRNDAEYQSWNETQKKFYDEVVGEK